MLDRPIIVHSPLLKCTAGFRVRSNGCVDLAVAFCKKPDVYKKKTGHAIIAGKLLSNKSTPGKHLNVGNYSGDKPLKHILPALIDTIKIIEGRTKMRRRSCQSIQTRLVNALNNRLFQINNGLITNISEEK